MTFRLVVRDVFAIAGRGTSVVGYIEGGSVQIGDVLTVERTGASSVLRDFGGVRDAAWKPGDAAAVGLVLPDLDLDDVAAGDHLLGVSEMVTP